MKNNQNVIKQAAIWKRIKMYMFTIEKRHNGYKYVN